MAGRPSGFPKSANKHDWLESYGVLLLEIDKKRCKVKLIPINEPLTKVSKKLNSKQYFQSRKKGRKVDALAHEDYEGRK